MWRRLTGVLVIIMRALGRGSKTQFLSLKQILNKSTVASNLSAPFNPHLVKWTIVGTTISFVAGVLLFWLVSTHVRVQEGHLFFWLFQQPTQVKHSNSFFLILSEQVNGSLDLIGHIGWVLVVISTVSIVMTLILAALTRGFRSARQELHLFAFAQVVIGGFNALVISLGLSVLLANLVVWSLLIFVNIVAYAALIAFIIFLVRDEIRKSGGIGGFLKKTLYGACESAGAVLGAITKSLR